MDIYEKEKFIILDQLEKCNRQTACKENGEVVNPQENNPFQELLGTLVTCMSKKEAFQHLLQSIKENAENLKYINKPLPETHMSLTEHANPLDYLNAHTNLGEQTKSR